MNKGTKIGEIEEKIFCEKYNNGEINLEKTRLRYSDNIIAVHATKHQFSKITKLLVKPKSDCFLIKDLNGYYKNKQDTISEDELLEDSFELIENSGISIKRPDSKNYQIHKFTPSSFLKLFNDDKCLGAGAMIYSMHEKDFPKNDQIIENIWGNNKNDFLKYFSNLGLEKLKDIQSYCLKEIKRLIDESQQKKDYVFTGKNTFDEPYCATYSFINGELEPYKYIDFYVSQGSGRITTPTIVIKPK